ncbi:hypothetical protein R3P38DRAFT_3221653 [Favolaschia claudopus]|uniref:Uncharacterized protein n=1 Tax=Favolaschia claudopus TaxID=2862362 RepID=A0AAV9ZZY0_9AGAR
MGAIGPAPKTMALWWGAVMIKGYQHVNQMHRDTGMANREPDDVFMRGGLTYIGAQAVRAVIVHTQFGETAAMDWQEPTHVSTRALQLTTQIMEAIGAIQFGHVWEAETKHQKPKPCNGSAADALLKGNQKAAFEMWKGQVGFVTAAARNKLAHAYQQFGLQILLDPFWSTIQLHTHKRTDDWAHVDKQAIGLVVK